MEKEGGFRNLDEGYQSRIASDCMKYLMGKSGGDICGLFDKLFFHPTKENGEIMKNVWLFLLEKNKGLIFYYSNLYFFFKQIIL
jgi:hypothetical protein